MQRDTTEEGKQSQEAPPARGNKTVLIWFTFCLALVLLVAFNMR